MRLTPTELDRLTIFTAAELARRRRAKGWKLTHPEALAIICDEMHEAARGGASYDDVVRAARGALTADEVLEGVPELIGTVKIECLFGDGMRVLHVDQPIAPVAATAERAGGGPAQRSGDSAAARAATACAPGGTREGSRPGSVERPR